MGASETDLPRGTRIVGLDAWRVMLMLGGFLLHASTWLPSRPLFTAVALGSHAFRMGSFFAISGFLCGVSMRKHSPSRWLARRVAQIGLPTLFGWGVLCPITIGIMNWWHPAASTPLFFDWLHIWFLVALLAYAPAAVWFDMLDRRYGLADRVAGGPASRRSSLSLLLGTAMVSFVLMITTVVMVPAIVPSRLMPMLSQAPMMAGYLPNYLLGVAMARSPALAREVQQSWRPALGIVAASGLLYALWFMLGPWLPGVQQEQGANLVMTVVAALCPPAAFALIFRSAVAVRDVPAIAHRICDASLTMYLVHLPLLLVANIIVAPLQLNPYVQYVLAIVMAAPLSYAAHRWIVRPVPLLSLIINGRLDHAGRPFAHLSAAKPGVEAGPVQAG
jgi:glucan biosynthesis protein C